MYWRNMKSIAMRDGKWKIIGSCQRDNFRLYNLDIDFRETTDLQAHYPQVFESLKNTLIEYDKEVLAEGPDWWKRDKKYIRCDPDYVQK